MKTMIHSIRNSIKVICVLILLTHLSACSKEAPETIWEEAPYIEDFEEVTDQLMNNNNIDSNTLTDSSEAATEVDPVIVSVVLSDKYPIPLDEWFSVQDGVFIRAGVRDSEVNLSIQNQAMFFYSDSILVMSREGKDAYAFFLPASLIPPYDYQVDFVAQSIHETIDVDSFRIVLPESNDWNEFITLAEYTELNLFVRQVDGVRGLFQGATQIRHRSTYEELDWSILEPAIKWTPPKAETPESLDGVIDGSLHPDSMNTSVNLTTQVGNITMYDLNLNPIIAYAGLNFSDMKFDATTMSFTGTVENVSNQGISQTVTFELLDEDWEPLSTVYFGPAIPDIGQSSSFKLNVSPSASRARFIRAVG